MKSCPTCSRVYSDDTLNFCFEDRTPLVGYYQTESLTSVAEPVEAFVEIGTEQTRVNNFAKGQRLTTKLYLPPPRQTLVERDWLLEQLNEGLKGKLTLISAPAGFGKTSLVTMWRKQSDIPLAWFSLDAEDNDPNLFADYLFGALQTVDERLGQRSANLLQASRVPPLKVFLTSLINEISEYESEFVLALDDYHVVHERSIHEAISFFIERLPPHAHALITTRSDPPFPLSRLRARSELKELRASDLRFG
ncbi:MAG: hypothetical protein ABL984_01580, partial [Pyrinomonadaceae bacterium]